MAYYAKAGSFNIDTSKIETETQAIEGVGFTPKVVLFWWSGSTATGDSVSGGSYNVGFGAAISSSSRFCSLAFSLDGAADSDTAWSVQNTECIRCFSDATPTTDGIMDFGSMDTDGFTLVVDNQFSNVYRISFLALGGSDLTNVYISNDQIPAVAGNYDVDGVGFQPDAVIFASQFLSSATDIYGSTARFCLGMATGASNEGVVDIYVADASATSNCLGYGYNGECISAGTSWRNEFVSFGADGFTLNCLETAAARYFYYIALAGGQYLVSDLTTRTDGNDIEEDVGFEPVAVLFFSANRALSTQDTFSNHARVSIGAGTATDNRAVQAISDEHGLADTETAYANYDSAVYAHVIDDAIEALMDIKSIDADGFTCVMDDTETAGCWVTYLAIGAAAGGYAERGLWRGLWRGVGRGV